MASFTGKAPGCKREEGSKECREVMANCRKKPGTICWRCEHFAQANPEHEERVASYSARSAWHPQERRPNFDAY